MAVEFELNGQKFVGLNGGPQFLHRSRVVPDPLPDQDEVDYYWSRLTEGGQEVACGC